MPSNMAGLLGPLIHDLGGDIACLSTADSVEDAIFVGHGMDIWLFPNSIQSTPRNA